MKTWLGGSKVSFESSNFTLIKIIIMWYLTNYVIQCVFPYVYGQNIDKPHYKYM